ncbi:MAG: inorganic phosphate transporter [Thermoflexales bacterium]|nr:inorganic phosphate transporter [Thermoflexales bacterium]
MTSLALIAILIAIAITFDFLNGFNDSANVVATIISSQAMSPRSALTLAAIANFVGPFIFGVAVAKTIGSEVAHPGAITVTVVLAALLSAIGWDLFTWYFGIPASSSHALIGGIIGAVVISAGFQALEGSGLIKVALALFTSPLLGFVAGWLTMTLMRFAARNATPRVNEFFKRAQLPTGFILALSHGTNDAQKTMGIITLGLVVLGFQSSFDVPWWVIVISATAIGLGTIVGGWRIIATIGRKFYRIRPIHSFSTQIASASVIIAASLLGGPVSTTHVVSTSVLGVGAAERVSQVRWGVLTEIVIAWLLTIPATAALSALLYLVLSNLIPAH